MTQQQLLQEMIKKKPFLAWDTKSYDKLSTEAIVERVMAYGDWSEFKLVEKILGVKKLSQVFKKLTNKKRLNLRPETVNLFGKYLQKYA